MIFGAAMLVAMAAGAAFLWRVSDVAMTAFAGILLAIALRRAARASRHPVRSAAPGRHARHNRFPARRTLTVAA
jgi:hypothetical protein